jgi:hypothetical protein
MKPARLKLDFAPGALRISRVGIGLLVASTVALGGVSVQLISVLSAHSKQADALAALDARRAKPSSTGQRSRPADPGEVTRTRVARQVAQNLQTPWGDLLESLETSPKQAVALLSVEPSVSKRMLRLTAEARTPQDMLDYLEALQHDPRLIGVVLVSHQVQSQAPGQPVRFSIQAGWGVAP